MKTRLLQGTAAALVLSCSAQVALADLAPQDVWSDWQNYLTTLGYELNAKETISGNTLTISDLSAVMERPDNQSSVVIGLGTLVFRDNGDGSVSLDMPHVMPLHVQSKGGEDDFDLQLTVTQSGASMVFTGSPDDITQSYRSGETVVAYSSLSVDGKPMPADALRATIALKEIITTFHSVRDDKNRTYDQAGSMGELGIDLFFNDPKNTDEMFYTTSLRNLTFKGQSTIPNAIATFDYAQMLQNGVNYVGSIGYSGGSSRFTGKAEDQDFMMTSSSSGGNLASGMKDGKLSYDVSQTDTEIMVQTNDLPFPIALASKEMGFKLDVPLLKSDADQSFAFGLTLADFTMPEELWGIFDPGKILPRDPATAMLDLTGTVKVLANVFDPEYASSIETPAELTSLTIKDLQLSAAGTSLTGKGDFTFDNTDTTTFDGMPAPDGAADIQLVGGNGLVDKLIEMGLMSDQDAMGARMMMGMLGTPGEGDDTLNSHIEVKPSGQIFANGQRLK